MLPTKPVVVQSDYLKYFAKEMPEAKLKALTLSMLPRILLALTSLVTSLWFLTRY